MFSFIPIFHGFEWPNAIKNQPRVFQVFHSTVSNTSYRSIGEKRADETHCIFHYTLKGHGEVIYQGKAYQTSPGEGFFNIINEKNSGYGYPKNGEEPWEFIGVCFTGGNIRELIKELLDRQVVYYLGDHNDKLARMYKELLTPPHTKGQVTFLSNLISLTSNEATSSELIISYQTIVKRDLLKNPTMEAIAQELRISREHLQRTYKFQTGTSPAKYLRDKRFELLCSLLSTSLSEEEICTKMHFPSVSGMTIFFKKIAGITPREYRKHGYFII